MEKTMMDKKTQKKGLKIQYNTKKKCDISDHRNSHYCVYYMEFVLWKHSDSL